MKVAPRTGRRSLATPYTGVCTKVTVLRGRLEKDRLTVVKNEAPDPIASTSRTPEFEAVGNRTTRTADVAVQREPGLTGDRLHDLQGSLSEKPAKDEQARDPRGLKVNLMPHQKHALAWLLWRETQNPAGGLYADDMGLGKTLTMISLLLATTVANEFDDGGDEASDTQQTERSGGTLIVVPPTLVDHWISEIRNHCEFAVITFKIFQGDKRDENVERLMTSHIVITTYSTLSRTCKNSGVLHKINWTRVILDDAHLIKNPKSQASVSVCSLDARIRWALTGTPIQNRELDLFAILKFLRCAVEKKWFDGKKNAYDAQRNAVVEDVMLRRMKQDVFEMAAIDPLPTKTVKTVEVHLDPQERVVYDKLMVYTRTLFAQYLAQRGELVKHKDRQFTEDQKKFLSLHPDVDARAIHLALLRLRQVCCQPYLIHAMCDKEELVDENELEVTDNSANLINQINELSMSAVEEDGGTDFGADVLTSENPVFAPNRRSSKIRAVIHRITEIIALKDKVIVVSQWVWLLEFLGAELDAVDGASCRILVGQQSAKVRQQIINDFNSPPSKTNILLMSMSIGGLGLDLVGANHLLLIDVHWNPQRERQADDRIYRVGQKKNSFIYKFVCTDTIEERLTALQAKKIQIADNLLSGRVTITSSEPWADEMRFLLDM